MKTQEKKMQAYAEMMAVITAALVKAMQAGVTPEAIAAALDQLKSMMEEED